MFDFLFWEKPITETKEDSLYKIIYFPIASIYTVVYKWKYLRTNRTIWFINVVEFSDCGGEHSAEKFDTEEDARQYIKQHKEQVSEFVVIIP